MNVPPDLPGWLRFWSEGLLRASLEGAVALALAWAVGAVFPRMPATARCWLWRLAYLKLLLALFVPGPLHLPLLPSGPVPQSSYYATPSAPATAPAPASPAGVEGAPAAAAAAPAAPVAFSVLFCLWVVGLGWSVFRIGREWRRARELHRECRVSEDPWLVERCAELAFLFGLRRAPRILLAEGRGSPLLVGSGGAAVLLPAAVLRDYAPEEVELMLAHELAHLKRGDLLWSWLPAVVHWVFFFHPLVWLANREWRLAQEMACDELALEVTEATAGEYGKVLVRVAAQSRLNLQGGLATVGLEESPETLKRRLGAMRHPRTLSPVRLAAFSTPVTLLGVLVLLPWKLSAAEAAPEAADRLRQGWQPGRSYSYQVEITADGEDSLEKHSGSLTYFAQAHGQTVALGHSGTLFPHRTPKQPGSLAPLVPMHSFRSGLLFGPGPAGMVRIDGLGRILEQRDGGALPFSLGAVARLVVEPLPERRSGAWEVSGDREILVEEEHAPDGFPAPPRFSRGSGLVRLSGREQGRYRIRKQQGDTLLIDKSYELRTVEELNGSPRLRLAGAGLLTWDLKQGVPRALELKATLTETTQHVTRRTPITLSYTLQAGQARQASVAPAPRANPAADTSALVADLRSDDRVRRQSAASLLTVTTPDGRRTEVAKALEGLLRDEDQLTRLLAAKSLRAWGNRENAPALIPLVRDREAGVSWAAMEALGVLRHPDGLKALAEALARDRSRFFAARSLREAGPAAEGAVLPLLEHEEETVRVEACRILEEIGGERSLEPLRRAAEEASPSQKNAAEQALAAVRARLRPNE